MSTESVKPYLRRVQKWKIRNTVMLYLDARDKYRKYIRLLRGGTFISSEKLREISDILYEIKEDHHLIYKRLVDPKKKKFDTTHKFHPTDIELEFINNAGLLFHKLMVATELKYLMEHYVEESDPFQKTGDSLRTQLNLITSLFDDGIAALQGVISQNNDNVLLLSLLLDNPDLAKRHFGKNAINLVEQFCGGKSLDEIYYLVGQYHAECGRPGSAKRMFKSALKKNGRHELARQSLARLSEQGAAA